MRGDTQESNTSSASWGRDGPPPVIAAARFGYCPVAAALATATRLVPTDIEVYHDQARPSALVLPA